MFRNSRRSFVLAPVPVFKRLRGLDRKRVEKSSKKVEQLLGATPVIDIIPASPRPQSARPPVSASARSPLKSAGKHKGKGRKAPPAPILRYKLPANIREPEQADDVALTPPTRPFARKAVPASLDLPTPIWRTMAMASAPAKRRRYTPRSPGMLLSPLSPLSPFSPIETTAMRQERYVGLRRLARVSRAFRDTVVDELPAFLPIPTDVPDTYLDLYRISTWQPSPTTAGPTPTSAFTSRPASSAYTACSIVDGRLGRCRRSVSMSFLRESPTATPTARMSFIVPHSASPASHSAHIPTPLTADPRSPLSARVSRFTYATATTSRRRTARYTLVIRVPSPRTPTARTSLAPTLAPPPPSATRSASSRASYTVVLQLPPRRRSFAPATPADEDSHMQQQQTAARATIYGLELTTPTTPAVEVRSPRAPYWVRQSYRPQGVRRTHSTARRAGQRVPPTPRTVRRERRQGWGGEWRTGAVEGLKEIKTPAPRRVSQVAPKPEVVVEA
ncbi:uncharacterized protein BXZ73DRAFT_55384 [Epithele typhae]|uniref:uncharacterized protein n=1 Tax=Epithele typhae TaxID=378194 RepID=UPI002007A4D2|nr:uncharacterized protein BXZ73DRAFT_55384 [Epithele typhae]KAH9913703.1 hypothetical protein BXZ73DRAFT_55384 [Epithele typhae]